MKLIVLSWASVGLLTVSFLTGCVSGNDKMRAEYDRGQSDADLKVAQLFPDAAANEDLLSLWTPDNTPAKLEAAGVGVGRNDEVTPRAQVVAGMLHLDRAGSLRDQDEFVTLGNSTTVGGVTETIITGNNLQVAFGSSVDTSYYGNGSYLVLYQSAGVDDIDVVVVPEPGTWAMMLGGLALLVFWQRRKAKRD
jgi:hypothetical protein